MSKTITIDIQHCIECKDYSGGMRGRFCCSESFSDPVVIPEDFIPSWCPLPDTQEQGWQDIATAPKDKSIMLFTKTGLIYCGKLRYGQLGEPSQDTFAWRCDSSGRFTNPTHWMPLPAPPEVK